MAELPESGRGWRAVPRRGATAGARYVGAALSLLLCGQPPPAAAHDWFSNYATGREEFESCCGDEDCRTAASLGNPRIVRRDDGGYNVQLGPHWIKYDFPAVHTSHDSQIWICYIDGQVGAPDPLCLFLPPGVS